MAKRIYLDYAAATPVDPRVKEAMEPFWAENFGNPGGLHAEGVNAKKAVQEARRKIARELGAKEEEIIFTGSGTESCNLAILGAARKYRDKGRHLITSKIEHHAVLHPFQLLEKDGFDVTYLEVGEEGIVKPEDLRKALRPETILVSIMYANNEMGTIQPIREIGLEIENWKLKIGGKTLFFHVDACQAAGYLDLNVANLGVDLMSFSGYKFYGPKGIGFLYKSRNVLLEPPVVGGEQEFGFRPGTEAVPLIVGMAKALKLSRPNEEENKRLAKLRDYFIEEILKRIPGSVLNGHPARRLPSNVNISFKGRDNEELVLRLDAEGIAVATGSACRRDSTGPSHVISALGREPEYTKGAIRFTLGRHTTKEELERALEVLPQLVLR
ncbi:MAG: cysteine desulfurase family protein [Patescibacteria group bacterium]